MADARLVNDVKEKFTLACGCMLWYDTPYPQVGETLWCRVCESYQVVVNGVPNYNVICRGQRCRFKRVHGRELNSARVQASLHVTTYPTHTVQIRNGMTIVEVVSNDEQGEAPFTVLINERHRLSRKQQDTLRSFLERMTVIKP